MIFLSKLKQKKIEHSDLFSYIYFLLNDDHDECVKTTIKRSLELNINRRHSHTILP